MSFCLYPSSQFLINLKYRLFSSWPSLITFFSNLFSELTLLCSLCSHHADSDYFQVLNTLKTQGLHTFPLSGVLSLLLSTWLLLILRYWLLLLPSPSHCSLLNHCVPLFHRTCNKTCHNLDLHIYLWFYLIDIEPYKVRDSICFIHYCMPNI